MPSSPAGDAGAEHLNLAALDLMAATDDATGLNIANVAGWAADTIRSLTVQLAAAARQARDEAWLIAATLGCPECGRGFPGWTVGTGTGDDGNPAPVQEQCETCGRHQWAERAESIRAGRREGAGANQLAHPHRTSAPTSAPGANGPL